MGNRARVGSIDAVKDFRAAMCSICETARNALGATEMDIRRAIDYLQYEQARHWEREIDKGREQTAQAQTDLNRVKLAKVTGSTVDDIEQKEALREAKDRVELAEEKLELIRKWTRIVEKASEEYLGQARQLADLVEGDPPGAVTLLDRVLDALDAYLKVEVPTDTSAVPAAVSAAELASPEKKA